MEQFNCNIALHYYIVIALQLLLYCNINLIIINIIIIIYYNIYIITILITLQ